MASPDVNNQAVSTSESKNLSTDFSSSSLPVFLDKFPKYREECESVTKKKILTLVIITDVDKFKVLLGMKKRGFGKGRWNGFGGKVEAGETIYQAAVREVEEECGLVASDLKEVGLLEFKFVDDPILLETYVYTTANVTGDIKESEEMRPKWFSVTDIPFSTMWTDDKFWFPLLLSNQAFKGYFLFKGQEKILDYVLNPIGKIRST